MSGYMASFIYIYIYKRYQYMALGFQVMWLSFPHTTMVGPKYYEQCGDFVLKLMGFPLNLNNANDNGTTL